MSKITSRQRDTWKTYYILHMEFLEQWRNNRKIFEKILNCVLIISGGCVMLSVI